MPQTRLTSSYVAKFVVAMALVALVIVVASVNLYLGMEPDLTSDQQSELISGLVSIVLVFTIGIGFVAASIGRETLSALNTLRVKTRQIERGNLEVNLATNKRDELGDLSRGLAAMRDTLRGRMLKTETQNQALQQCASEYCDVMRKVGDGDLSQRLNEDTDIDEMAQLARDFNRMMDQLERTVGEVYTFTDRVAEATDSLNKQTEQSIRASAQVYNAAQEMNTGDSGQEMETLPQLEDTQIEPDRPVTTDGELVQVEDTVDAIDRLNQQMDQIDEIVEFIGEVADETNMLALNASIEASKVDSDGAEGFQVVAEEVKTLAEETRDGTDEIETVSRDIRGGTNDAVNNILGQQAALVSTMDEHANELSEAARELRLTLSQLDIEEFPAEENIDTRAFPDEERR